MKDSEDLKKLVISRSKIVKFLVESRELFLSKEVLAVWENIIKVNAVRGWDYGLRYLDLIQLIYVSKYLEIETPVDIISYQFLEDNDPYRRTQIFDESGFSINELVSMKDYIELDKFPKIFPKLCSLDSFNALKKSNPEFFSKLMQLCKEHIELLNSFRKKIESISIFLLNKDVTLKFIETNLPELYKYYDKV